MSAASEIQPADAAGDAGTGAGGPIIETLDVAKHFSAGAKVPGQAKPTLKAVDGVSLAIRRGQTLALVGETGSGKTTFGRLLLGLYRPTSGDIRYRGTSILDRKSQAARDVRRQVQGVFQDPYSSLNPRKRIRHALAQPLRNLRICAPSETQRRSARLLELMGLTPAREFLDRFPHELSGGQRQRVVLARALAAEPRVLVADEPVSSLDMSTRAQILGLVQALRREVGVSVLLITHDLAIVSKIADRAGVMYLGRLFEVGPVASVIAAPLHPYTRMLVAAVPMTDPAAARKRIPVLLAGEPPSPVDLPGGCYFHPRCPHAMDVCRTIEPPWRELAPGHRVACHLYP